jgi:hypothetical protein
VTELTAAIVAGCRCSATFQRIVARLDLSADVVYVNWARNGTLPRLVEAAFLPNVTAAPDGTRYLWVIVRRGLSGEYLSSVIAHELQHALEVAEDPTLRTAAAVEERFARDQRGNGSHILETDAAVGIGRTVYDELRRASAFKTCGG